MIREREVTHSTTNWSPDRALSFNRLAEELTISGSKARLNADRLPSTFSESKMFG